MSGGPGDCRRDAPAPGDASVRRDDPPRRPDDSGLAPNEPDRPARRSVIRSYRFIDVATQSYLAVVAVLLIIFHNETVPHWTWLLAGHLGAMVLVHALIVAYVRRPRNRVVAFLRPLYPIALYTFLYMETSLLNQMVVHYYLDDFFIRWDRRLFGFQPSLRFVEALPWLPVSDILYAGYFSYYVMISGVGIALYFKNRKQCYHYVAMVSFVFYSCYLFYILVPVAGPLAFWSHRPLAPPLSNPLYVPGPQPEAIMSGPFYIIMRFIYSNVREHGAAFPSSHVAVAIVTLTYTWRYLPRIRIPHLVVVCLLCLATVYCRYHYVVDVWGGIVTAALLLPPAELLCRRLEDKLDP